MSCLTMYFLVPRRHDVTKSVFLYRAQNLPSLFILFTNMTLSTLPILTVCRTGIMNFVIDLGHWRICSGRASECGNRRSDVRFLIGTQNFFFVPRSWQDEKHLSLFLYRAQNLPSLLFYYVLLLVNVTDQLKSGTYQENLAITTSWKLLKW